MGSKFKALAVFVAALLLVLLVDWGNGTFHSEFGRYADEGMHYITGLLIRDYVGSLSWNTWRHPMQFALDYYAHLPKVALGNWPPIFETMQASWELVFGVSRNSLMVLMAILTASLATVVFRASSSRLGWAAIAAPVALIAAPLTQAQTAMVMAEIPLALFSFLAVLRWIDFLDKDRPIYGVAFGFWTTVAILTKGNGWAVPALVALSIVALWEWSVLRKPAFWKGVALVACTCVPYTLLTMNIVVQGWNQRSAPDPGLLLASLGVHHAYVAEVLGWPLYLLVWTGILDRVVLPLTRKQKPERFWSILALYGAVILVFHSAVPTSLEPRKIYQIAPVLCVFLVAGVDLLARLLMLLVPSRAVAVGAAMLVAAAGFWANGFELIEPFAPGFGPAVETMLRDPLSRGTAVLVSSNPTFADCEAAIIAEWASRSRGDGTYLLRGTKQLSQLVPSEGSVDYEPLDRTPQDLAMRLKAVPVSYVILHTTPYSSSYLHHALLETALEQDSPEWTKISDTSKRALDANHRVQIYRYYQNVQGVPIHFEVDLSRKLGSDAVTGAGQ